MNGKNLDEISDEHDSGVIVQQDLKWNKQIRNLLIQPIECTRHD
jgi:hypothetical protein